MIDFPKLLRLLTEHNVAFIIIGGVAAVIPLSLEDPSKGLGA